MRSRLGRWLVIIATVALPTVLNISVNLATGLKNNLGAWLGVIVVTAAAVPLAARATKPENSPALTEIRPADAVPDQLNGSPTHFVNRDVQLMALKRLRTPKKTRNRRPQLALITGPGGVGKTGLVEHWASVSRVKYVDGRIFRDLRGFDETGNPEPAMTTLAAWLNEIGGVKGTEIPDDEGDRLRLFRKYTSGKRILFVLDNANNAAQVRRLLPTSGSCTVIVTSRDKLPGLASDGAIVVTVNALSVGHSLQMLRGLVGPRIDADEISADLLVTYCAGNPMALRVTAGQLAATPDSPVAEQVRRLEDERHRLRRLTSEDYDVRAILSWSYHSLSPDAQHMFRVFGIHPPHGGSIDVYTAATLADVPYETAADLLHTLNQRNLVEGVGGRYRMLDLTRLLAREFGDSSEANAAVERLIDALHGSVNHAFDLVNQGNPMVDSEFLAAWRVSDPQGVKAVQVADQPATWFAAELPNLMSALRIAAAMERPPPRTAKFACGLFYFLETGGHHDQWAEVEEIAARIAQVSPDRCDLARSLRNRGRLAMVRILDQQESLCTEFSPTQTSATSCQDAIELLTESRSIYEDEYARTGSVQDLAGKATILRELADAYRIQAVSDRDGDSVEAAIEAYRMAGQAYDELGNDNGLASLHLALGIAYVIRGAPDDFDKAEQLYQSSLKYSSTIVDGRPRHVRLNAFSLRRWGDLYRIRGDHASAITRYGESVAVFRNLVQTDKISRGRVLALRGRTMLDQVASGRENHTDDVTVGRAREALEEAVALLADKEDEVALITEWMEPAP